MASLIRISLRTKTSFPSQQGVFSSCQKVTVRRFSKGKNASSHDKLWPLSGFRSTSFPTLAAMAGGSSWCCFSAIAMPTAITTTTTLFESSSIIHATNPSDVAKVYQGALALQQQQQQSQQNKFQRAKKYISRALRMALRAATLLCTLTPVVALYPLQRFLQARNTAGKNCRQEIPPAKIVQMTHTRWPFRIKMRKSLMDHWGGICNSAFYVSKAVVPPSSN